MSTTTQILFNSPALHSLKRDQLVKLCKIHSIKASGKNVELIEKLKQHAQTLPRDSPLSLAARSETAPAATANGKQDDDAEETGQTETKEERSDQSQWNFQMPRPSEQWEVVMESIEETMEDSSSQGTLSSMRTLGTVNGGSGEFGTANSKSTGVGSSIRALASSFGLKRHNSSKSTVASSSSFPTSSSFKSLVPTTDELSQHSKPYSTIPDSTSLPQNDHFTFNPSVDRNDPPTPLPGQTLRPGIPAPENARLSLGLGLGAPSTPTRQEPTTTIRLISSKFSNDQYGRTPQLKPFKTSFDLVMGSPTNPSNGFSFGGGSIWPRDDTEEKLYPTLPLDDFSGLSPAIPTKMDTGEDSPMPGSLSRPTDAPTTPTRTTRLAVPTKPVEPFIFGSPLPQHNVTNTQFKSAAASVLEEMNKRLKEEGVESVGMGLISKLQPGAHANGVPTISDRAFNALPKASEMKEKFERMHQEEFKKMEGIDSLVKRRGVSPDKGSREDRQSGIGKKRKSSVLGHGAGRDRYGRRIGGDSAAGRLSGTRVISNGRRPRILPGSFDTDDEDDESADDNGAPNDVEERDGKRVRVEEPSIEPDAKDDGELEKERERKQKEKEAIRRKLEMNKARRRSSAGVAGARGRVSVGRGGVLVKPQPKPSRFGFLSSAKSLVQNVWNRGKATTTAAPTNIPTSGIPKPTPKLAPPVQVPPKKAPSVGVSRQSTIAGTPSGNHVPSLRLNKEKEKETIASSSTRARSPIPSFNTASSARGSMMGTGTKASRGSSTTGTGASTKSGSTTGVSSVGTRSSFLMSSKLSSLGVGSMGSKKLSTGSGRAAATGSSSKLSSNSRLSSSRLLAPTASSLAKTTRPSTSGLRTVAEANRSMTTTLDPITNSPGAGNGPWSPRPGGIFSRPLDMPSGIPTPVKRKPVEPVLSLPDVPVSIVGPDSKTVAPTRQRSLAGRKPRISRSKVIAKLASQRAAGGSATGRIGGTPSHGGRTRSSIGAKAQRSSMGGKSMGGANGDVMMSAKKRARQSEYARRRSRVGPLELGGGANKMDVDDD